MTQFKDQSNINANSNKHTVPTCRYVYVKGDKFKACIKGIPNQEARMAVCVFKVDFLKNYKSYRHFKVIVVKFRLLR